MVHGQCGRVRGSGSSDFSLDDSSGNGTAVVPQELLIRMGYWQRKDWFVDTLFEALQDLQASETVVTASRQLQLISVSGPVAVDGIVYRQCVWRVL